MLLNILITLFLSILVIGVLVFIHELGHFFVAKKSGVVVQEFAFGFGRKLFSKKYKGTDYRINLFPFGGYVKMLGDVDGSSFVRIEAKATPKEDKAFALKLLKENKLDPVKNSYDEIETFFDSQKEKLDKESFERVENYFYKDYIPNHPGNYDNIKTYKKIAIVSAGVVMNFLFGIILFYVYFAFTGQYTDLKKIGNPVFFGAELSNPPVLMNIYGTDNFSPSLVIKADGKLVNNFAELDSLVKENYNKSIKLELYDFSVNKYIESSYILDGDGIKSSYDADYYGKVQIAAVQADSFAQKSGILPGILVYEIAGEKTDNSTKLKSIVEANKGKTVEMKFINLRGIDEKVTLALPNVENGKVVLGVSLSDTDESMKSLTEIMRVSYEKNSVYSGVLHSVNMAIYNFTAMGELINQSVKEKDITPVSSSVSSVFAISDIFYSFVKMGNFIEVINMSALVSITLAIMNILPIPLFDGGQLLFIAIEKIRGGKKLSSKTQERIGGTVFYILIGLSILIVIKDFIQFDWINRIINLISGFFK
jgi:regulator of sigma E protease